MFFKITLMIALLCTTGTLHAEPIKVKFGYVLNDISTLDARDLQLGYQYVANRFAKRYNVQVDIVYDMKGTEIVPGFIRNDVQYLGMSFSVLATILPRIEPYIGDILVSSTSNDLLESYVILTNNPSIKSLGDLCGKRAVMQEKEGNAITYADMTTLERYHKRYKDFFDVRIASSSQRAILMLFFNQADLAFVPLRSWEIAKTLNPAIAQKVRVLETSPKVFGYGVELYRKDLSPEMLKIARQSNKEIPITEDGKQLLRIIKVTKRIPVTMNELKFMLSYYLRYQNLLTHDKGQ